MIGKFVDVEDWVVVGVRGGEGLLKVEVAGPLLDDRPGGSDVDVDSDSIVVVNIFVLFLVADNEMLLDGNLPLARPRCSIDGSSS